MERLWSNHRLQSLTVLVTGGCGFVGSHLVRRLLEEGARVAVVGRDTTNPQKLRDVIQNIDFYSVDVRNLEHLKACVGAVRPHIIFHLAAYGVDSTCQNELDAVEVNVVGMVNVLKVAKAHGVQRVINLGSSSEYGDTNGPVQEIATLAPVDIYGSTKAAATMIAHQIALEQDMSLITFRPFGIFGEYEDPHKLFSYVILSALNNKEVNLTTCQQFRDYCYVGNIVDGLIMASTSSRVHQGIFNIGTGEIHPLRYYIELIFKHLATTKKPNYGVLPYRANERWCSWPDIHLIQTQLGWQPQMSVEDGIIRTVNWYVHHEMRNS